MQSNLKALIPISSITTIAICIVLMKNIVQDAIKNCEQVIHKVPTAMAESEVSVEKQQEKQSEQQLENQQEMMSANVEALLNPLEPVEWKEAIPKQLFEEEHEDILPADYIAKTHGFNRTWSLDEGLKMTRNAATSCEDQTCLLDAYKKRTPYS